MSDRSCIPMSASSRADWLERCDNERKRFALSAGELNVAVVGSTEMREYPSKELEVRRSTGPPSSTTRPDLGSTRARQIERASTSVALLECRS